MLHPKERNWPLDEVKRQLNVTRQIGVGHCYFRAKFLLDNIKGVYDYVCDFDRHPALIPPMTWMHQSKPLPPTMLQVERTTQGDMLTWSGARDGSNGPYLLYNIYASTEQPVDIDNPANLVATRHLWQRLSVRRKPNKAPLYYAVTALDRYGNESAPVSEPTSSQPVIGTSSLIANDGRSLKVSQRVDADYLAVLTLQGSIVHTCANRPQIDIRTLPNGTYELRTLNRKGIMHRLGFFIIKR
jgi:hypothetical protein